MKQIIICFLIFLSTAGLRAQTFHTVKSFLLYMVDSSKVRYNLNLWTSQNIKPVKYENLGSNDYRQVIVNGYIELDSLKISGTGKKYFDKAESFFAAMQLDSAITYYKMAYNEDSAFTKSLTYIGQCYEAKGEYAKAVAYLKKAVYKNFIDFTAHWFLANCYLSLNKTDLALEQISIAGVLGRNDPILRDDMRKIYLATGNDFNEWSFSPQYSLSQGDDKKECNVYADYDWFIYGLAKAAWKYEPGYLKKVNIESDPLNIYEDIECGLLLAEFLENKKDSLDKYTDLKKFYEAYASFYVYQFIYYEIILPKHPMFASLLKPQEILDIKDYLINIRYKK